MRRLLILLIALMLWPAMGRAADTANAANVSKLPPIMTTYDVYVGGLHFLTAEILFDEGGGRYRARLHAQTYGYLYKLLQWDGYVSSNGKIRGDHFAPSAYRSLDVWRGKPKITALSFDSKGDISASFNPPNTDKNREIVTDEQKRGALDPATALLQMLAHVAVNQSCEATVPVFDGKRRFDLVGEDRGEEDIQDNDYNIYSGPARLCYVDFTMIAGEWKDREKNGFWQREDGQPGREAFHVWLANVAPKLPELPVRMESGSVFGLVVGHLTNWHYATPAERAASIADPPS